MREAMIYGEYDLSGYDIAVVTAAGEILEEYICGNHQLDSGQFVPPGSRFSRTLDDLKSGCQQTCDEMKGEYEEKGYLVAVSVTEREYDTG